MFHTRWMMSAFLLASVIVAASAFAGALEADGQVSSRVLEGQHHDSGTGERKLDGDETSRHEFSISPSVAEGCHRMIERYGSMSGCRTALAMLAKLAQEHRDVAWAHRMETEVRDIIEQVPGGLVRTLECRATLCALEVASSDPMFSVPTPVQFRTGRYESPFFAMRALGLDVSEELWA